jgi:hypothetical protein
MTHPQNQPETWSAMTDEEIVHALFNNPSIVNPTWINYLKRQRPQALRTYLQMLAADGGYLGPPAQRFLRKGF